MLTRIVQNKDGDVFDLSECDEVDADNAMLRDEKDLVTPTLAAQRLRQVSRSVFDDDLPRAGAAAAARRRRLQIRTGRRERAGRCDLGSRLVDGQLELDPLS